MSVSKLVSGSFDKAFVNKDFSNHFLGSESSIHSNKKIFGSPFDSAALQGVSSAPFLGHASNAESLKQEMPNAAQKKRTVLLASYAPPGLDLRPRLRDHLDAEPVWKPKEVSRLNELFNQYRKINDEPAADKLHNALLRLGVIDKEGIITPVGEKKLHAMHDTGLWSTVKLGIAPVALTENGIAFKQPLFVVLELMSRQLRPHPDQIYSAINPEQRRQIEASITETIRQFGDAQIYSNWVSKMPLPEAIKNLGPR